MHSAPSVIYPVGRSLFLARLLASMWLVVAGVQALWWWHQSDQPFRVSLLVGMLLTTGVFAWHWWRCQPVGRLAWDGRVWMLQQDGHLGSSREASIGVALDMQSHLLVRLSSPATGQVLGWLWLDAADSPAHWHALRCAVYSRAITEAQPDNGAVDT